LDETDRLARLWLRWLGLELSQRLFDFLHFKGGGVGCAINDINSAANKKIKSKKQILRFKIWQGELKALPLHP